MRNHGSFFNKNFGSFRFSVKAEGVWGQRAAPKSLSPKELPIAIGKGGDEGQEMLVQSCNSRDFTLTGHEPKFQSGSSENKASFIKMVLKIIGFRLWTLFFTK